MQPEPPLLCYKWMSDTSQISGTTAREIAASIERSVREGGLAPGTALPSVRELSRALGLSPVTIVAALRELRQRGIVLTRERRRTIVNPRPPLPPGLVPIPVPLDDRGMQPKALASALRSGARALVLTPRGQNPTGAALDAHRAKAIRELLRRAPDLLVIEDDHQGPVSGVRGESVIAVRRL